MSKITDGDNKTSNVDEVKYLRQNQLQKCIKENEDKIKQTIGE